MRTGVTGFELAVLGAIHRTGKLSHPGELAAARRMAERGLTAQTGRRGKHWRLTVDGTAALLREEGDHGS